MKRRAYQDLVRWKSSPYRKPLIIQGARQVGKTHLMRQFGASEFDSVAYFNFESRPELHPVFSQSLDPERIISSLNLLSDIPISLNRTLLIFDEIQACPNAITALKYFHENAPGYPILAAGSLLGVAMHAGVSFPVGKVDFLPLYPFDFIEFLEAIGKEKWIAPIIEQDWEQLRVLETEYINLLKTYLLVGGMPEAVVVYKDTGDLKTARNVQESILQAYENDFSKHAPVQHLPRIRMVWQSIVGQLAKENSKFIYSLLRQGARAKDFEMAIAWLSDAGLIHKVTRVSKAGLPPDAYADWSDFKLYLNDCGLLAAMAKLPPAVLLDENRLFTEFKGILAEQYVLQQLIAHGIRPFYWHPENADAEVDFLFTNGQELIPLEVKSSDNVRSRSLSVYSKLYSPERCLRTSLLPYQRQSWMENTPLYGLPGWLGRPSES